MRLEYGGSLGEAAARDRVEEAAGPAHGGGDWTALGREGAGQVYLSERSLSLEAGNGLQRAKLERGRPPKRL